MTDLNPYEAPQSPLLGRVPDGRPEPTMLGWGIRYMVVGAVFGFLLSTIAFPGAVESVPFKTALGAVVGATAGCVGGVFDRWLRRRDRERLASFRTMNGARRNG